MSKEERKIAPYLLVFIVLIGALLVNHNYTKAGTLGDLFNGVIAPFIALFSAILIYRSFKAQTEANKMQYEANLTLQSQWQFDTFLKLFNEIENRYRALEISVKITSRITETGKPPREEKRVDVHKGYDYFEYIELNHGLKQEATANWLVAPAVLLEEFRSLVLFVHKSNINDKLLVYDKLNIFFTNFLEKPVISMANRLPKDGANYIPFHTSWTKILKVVAQMRQEWMREERKKQEKLEAGK